MTSLGKRDAARLPGASPPLTRRQILEDRRQLLSPKITHSEGCAWLCHRPKAAQEQNLSLLRRRGTAVNLLNCHPALGRGTQNKAPGPAHTVQPESVILGLLSDCHAAVIASLAAPSKAFPNSTPSDQTAINKLNPSTAPDGCNC